MESLARSTTPLILGYRTPLITFRASKEPQTCPRRLSYSDRREERLQASVTTALLLCQNHLRQQPDDEQCHHSGDDRDQWQAFFLSWFGQIQGT